MVCMAVASATSVKQQDLQTYSNTLEKKEEK